MLENNKTTNLLHIIRFTLQTECDFGGKNLEDIANSVLLDTLMKALYAVASRRTSKKFADETIGSTIKTLERKYDVFKYVTVNQPATPDSGFAINISQDVNDVRPQTMGKAIEALLRVVYNDLSDEAGLYFITELKQLAGDQVSKAIMNREVDLDQVQLEQHYAYQRRERKKEIEKAAKKGLTGRERPENYLGYTWPEVASWKHQPNSKYCTLYNKKGEVIDQLNLDRIIQNYVEKLSGYSEDEVLDISKEALVYEKEYELLKLMLERDMDAETALHYLKVSKEELNNMIRKLSEMEMLQFVNYDTLEITNMGINYLSKKNKEDKKKN